MKIQRSPNADYALDCIEIALDLRWTIILRIILRIILHIILTQCPVFEFECPVFKPNVLKSIFA